MISDTSYSTEDKMVTLLSDLIQASFTPDEWEKAEKEITEAFDLERIDNRQYQDLIWELYYTRAQKTRTVINVAFACGAFMAWLVTSIGFVVGFVIF